MGPYSELGVRPQSPFAKKSPMVTKMVPTPPQTMTQTSRPNEVTSSSRADNVSTKKQNTSHQLVAPQVSLLFYFYLQIIIFIIEQIQLAIRILYYTD